MNQTNIRHLLAAGWGVYGGAILGYFLAKKVVQKRADEEIESVVARFNAREDALTRDSKKLEILAQHQDVRGVSVDFAIVDEIIDLDNDTVEQVVDKFTRKYDTANLKSDPRDELLGEDYEEDTSEGTDWTTIPVPEDVSEKIDSVYVEGGFTRMRHPDTQPEDPSRPYTISVDEYNESDYSKEQLIYYDGDDVLTDRSDKVVRQVDKIIGDEAITKFGDRSDDTHIVYVRNERLLADYEVVLKNTSYFREVLGLSSGKTKGRMKFDVDDGD